MEVDDDESGRDLESQEFARWLRRELQRQEWSQAEFARRLGVGTGTVSRWLSGRRPDTDYIDRIAELVGANQDTLLSLAGHRPRDLDVDPDSPPERFHAMMQRIQWDPQREALLEAILTQMLEFDRNQRAQTNGEESE